MSENDIEHAAKKRFARTFFAGTRDDEDQGDDRQKQPADDGLDDQRRFAADLFASDPEDAPILAGLKHGRTVGRTTPPRPDPTPPDEFRFS